MIKKETITKTLAFLNDCKENIAKPGFDPHELSSKHHVSNARFYYAVKCGYFAKHIYPTGIRYFCNVEVFEPRHARKIIESESRKIINGLPETKAFKHNLLLNKETVTEAKDFELNIDVKPIEKIPPTLDAVKEYCALRRNNVNPDQWYAHYESVGWMIGKKKMINWQGAVRTWENSNRNVVYVNKKITDFTDAEIQEDALRRKFQIKTLSNYSTDELLAELKRRGYTGNLAFTL